MTVRVSRRGGRTAAAVICAGAAWASEVLPEASRALSNGQHQQAIDLLVPYCDKNPESDRAWLLLGIALYEAEEYARAERALAQVDQVGLEARAWYYQALCFLQLGREAEAMTRLTALVHSYPACQETSTAMTQFPELIDTLRPRDQGVSTTSGLPPVPQQPTAAQIYAFAGLTGGWESNPESRDELLSAEQGGSFWQASLFATWAPPGLPFSMNAGALMTDYLNADDVGMEADGTTDLDTFDNALLLAGMRGRIALAETWRLEPAYKASLTWLDWQPLLLIQSGDLGIRHQLRSRTVLQLIPGIDYQRYIDGTDNTDSVRYGSEAEIEHRGERWFRRVFLQLEYQRNDSQDDFEDRDQYGIAAGIDRSLSTSFLLRLEARYRFHAYDLRQDHDGDPQTSDKEQLEDQYRLRLQCEWQATSATSMVIQSEAVRRDSSYDADDYDNIIFSLGISHSL